MEEAIKDANAVRTILDSAAQPQIDLIDVDSIKLGNIPVLFTPKNQSAQILNDLEKYLAEPLRKHGTVKFDDATSFIAYLKKHGAPGTCSIWLSANYATTQVNFTGILNDNTAAATAWRDFRATYRPIISEEWKLWTSNSGKAMSQMDFATFIEDNFADLAEAEGMPTPSQLMAMALDFHVTSEKTLKSSVRTQSGGVQLNYTDREDAATQTLMEMFQRFALGITPFFGSPAYRVNARFKYKQRDGKLSIWYELIHPEKVLEDATQDLIDKIQEGTDFEFYYGSPD